MSRILVNLRGYGDQIIMLPLLYSDFQKSGEKQKVLVHQDYASLYEGTSYIEPIVWKGSKNDIAGAKKEAAKHGEPLAVQVVGNAEIVKQEVYGDYKQKTDSFEREMWSLAGRLKDWKRLESPVFDKRSPDREKRLLGLIKKEKTILVSCGGQSSPFPYKPLLMELLKLRFFRSHQIIDLDEVKAERIYDMLGLVHASSVLVASDSAILHLSNAAKIPTVALIQDSPSHWRGSAYRPYWIDCIRYSQFPRYAVGMLDAIANIGKKGDRFMKNAKRVFHISFNKKIEVPEGEVNLNIPEGAFSKLVDGKPYLRSLLSIAIRGGNSINDGFVWNGEKYRPRELQNHIATIEKDKTI